MNKQKTLYCEIAYLIGIITLAFGAALMEKADFGVSMVVAPAYVIHLKVSQYLPFYSFGMSEYVFQAFLLGLLSVIIGKFKKSCFLSFVTAVIYGLVLDVMIGLVALFPYEGIAWQFLFYVLGMITCSIGVALLFHTYLPPEAYEMFVKEIAQKFSLPIGKTKTIYDCCSSAISIILSFVFFGFGTFVGVKWGTIVCTIFNGWLISQFGNLLEKSFVFKDAYPLRSKFD